jgi:hypothetical protein
LLNAIALSFRALTGGVFYPKPGGFRPRRIQTGHLTAGSPRSARTADTDTGDSLANEAVINYKGLPG